MNNKATTCNVCGHGLKCPRCTGKKGGSVCGKQKARTSDQARKAVMSRWEKHRAKWHKHLESVEESTK